MKKGLIGLGMALLIVFLAVAALLFTQRGFSLLIHAGERFSNGALRIGAVHGSLRESFSFEDIRYNSEAVDLEIDRFVYAWSPAALLEQELRVSSVVIEGVGLNIKAGEDPAPPMESQGIKLPDIALPLGIMIGELQGMDITIAAGGSVVAELQEIHLELSGSATDVDITTLYVKGEGLELEMGGTVSMDQRWPVDITASWRYADSAFPELQGSCSVTDTVLDGGVSCAVTAPFDVRLEGSYELDDGVRWQADVEADDADPSLFLPNIPGLLDIAFSTRGRMRNDELVVSLVVEKIDGTVLSWPLAVRGSAELINDALTVSGFEFAGGDSHIRAEGAVLPALDMDFDIDVADVGTLLPSATDTLQGDLQGTLQGRGTLSGSLERPIVTMEVEGRKLVGQGVSVASLHLEGEAEAAIDGEMDLAVALEDVRGKDQYVNAVSLDFDGSIPEHAVKLNVLRDDLSLVMAADGGLQAGMWQGVIGEFNLKHSRKGAMELVQPARLSAAEDNVSLGEFCLRHEAARLCMDGRLADSRWQASVAMKEADPSFFFADWPGRVNVTVRGEGDVSAPQRRYFLEIADLSGEVNGLSLDGGGTVEQQGTLLRFSDINLHYGDAGVVLDGLVEETFDVAFEVDIPRLKELVPQMQGMFEASGQFYGKRQSPALELAFTTENGAGPTISWAALQGQIDVDLLGSGAIDAEIHGVDIAAGTTDISKVSLFAHGTRLEHVFALDAATSLGTLAVQGEGGYDTFWQGALNNVQLFMEKYGSWQLDKPAAFVMGGERSRLESFCLVDEEASLCVDGSLDKVQGWAVNGSIDNFPLDLLSQSGLSAIPLEGKLQSTVEAVGDGARLLELDAWLKIPRLEVKDPRESGQQYQCSEIALVTAIEDQSLKIDLNSRFAEQGRLVGNLSLKNFNDHLAQPESLPFSGQLDFDLQDLAFITILTGSRFEPTGKLVGNFDFQGTPAAPVARGNIDLQKGNIFIADLGITLEDMETQLQTTGKSLQYTISAGSGPGSVKSDGVLSFDAAQGMTLKSSLQGTDFDVMATDEYTIRISPKVQVEVDGEGGSITGEVHVPYGRIAPEFGSSGGVTASKDVVVVDDVGQQEAVSKQFVTDITISLGDDVRVVAYGLKSNVTGEIGILDEPGKNLAAQGELTVQQGKFALYSAELDIIRGRLLFSGGTVDNPGVDFRAQREIAEKTVGVDVTGTAQNLEFQFFSDPVMDQSNILSYILAGRSMYGSNGGGDTNMVEAAAKALGLRGVNTVTNALEKYIPVDEIYIDGGSGAEDISIVLGTNITEDLFVGYDHNFFDSAGEFKARYNLGYNFSLETKSSVEATSGDILYTIEK